jgi:hypothetical protein
MLADNGPMLKLLRALSPRVSARPSAGQLEVEVPLR